jgi:hypothetical protein
VDGKATIYSDNKGALLNVFHNDKSGITPYTATDYNLVGVAKTLVSLLPISLVYEWIEGHTNNNSLPHQLNQIAEEKATSYHTHPNCNFKPGKMPMAEPGYQVHLIYSNSEITSRMF